MAQTQISIPSCTTCDDTDKDGIKNIYDQCPTTPVGQTVNAVGCEPSSNGTAEMTFSSCQTASAGTITQGTAVTGVTQTITVDVATAGTYNISASVAGVTFAASGTLAAGLQDIVLTATGTSSAAGTISFTLNTTPNCTFTRSIAASGGTGTGGEFGIDFTSTFKDMSYSRNASAGITPDGKVFVWGNLSMERFFPTLPLNTILYTPAYLPLPVGELAKKVRMGPYHFIAVLTESNKIYVIGNAVKAFGSLPIATTWTPITVGGESTFLDFDVSSIGSSANVTFSAVITASGKAYYSGTLSTSVIYPTFAQLPAATTGVTYSKIWLGQSGRNQYGNFFLKGSDGKIYATGPNNNAILGNGVLGTTATFSYTTPPSLVQFPANTDIVDIIFCEAYAIGLDANGLAYGWGYWLYGPYYTFPVAGGPTAPANLVVSGTDKLLTKPTLLQLPAGSSKFTSFFIGLDNISTTAFTDNACFYKGDIGNNKYINPVKQPTLTVHLNTPLDLADGFNFNQKWNLLSGVIKKLYAWGPQYAYGVNANNKAYTWGTPGQDSNGVGLYFTGNSARPTPIVTGIGDTKNPNPLY
jgi:alpha-tubulin suppressor-like RCC1 family protein